MKTICSALFLLTSIALLSGCNTVKGFGQDMQQGGQELQKAVNNQQKS